MPIAVKDLQVFGDHWQIGDIEQARPPNALIDEMKMSVEQRRCGIFFAVFLFYLPRYIIHDLVAVEVLHVDPVF